MSEDQKSNPTGAGAPVKMQQLANKLGRARTKAFEAEIKHLESLVDEVYTDYATLKGVADGSIVVNSQQMKAIQMRIDRFLKFVEKADMAEALESLDTEGVINAETKKDNKTKFTPKVVFSAKAT